MTIIFRKIAVFLLFFPLALSAIEAPRIEALGMLDKQFMDQQRSNLEELSRRHTGRHFNGKPENDLAVLQLLLDRRIVKSDQPLLLQAMGVILGDLLVNTQPVNWIVYSDEYGRSRALQVPAKDDVVFPVTMISRRAQSGSQVDVHEIYQLAKQEIEHIRQKIYIK